MFEREDWKLFRNIETLCQKAGVNKDLIPHLVVKELVDNALDVSDKCDIGMLPTQNGFYVHDYGDGINENILKDLFSINRPMITSKLLRLPSRGALGNGLRVVTGAVVSTNGQLFVSTRGYKYEIIPQEDGTTKIEKIDIFNKDGTKIEVVFGKTLSVTQSILAWGKNAILFARGDKFICKTSAYWYTSEAFYELCNAYNGTVENLLLLFEGMNKIKVKEIAEERPFIKILANEINFEQSDLLLGILRGYTKPVSVKRLGCVGENYSSLGEYNRKYGTFKLYSLKGNYNADIPYIVETWLKYTKDFVKEILVNKTPITGSVSSWYQNKTATIYGCGLIVDLKTKTPQIGINIITPYMPITSDGKSPDFSNMNSLIKTSLNTVNKKAKKIDLILNNSNAKNEKDIFLNNIETAIDKASGYGQYRFSQRQLYYAIRPYIMNALDKQPEYTYFCRLLTEYENEYGDIKNLYRDPRGILYHPHLGEEIPLGTIAVQNYERPEWTFNKILYSEKEGFFPILRDAKFPERYDCALLTSKGYASRAVKDLFDLLGETDEEIKFFCIHDSDAAGTMIYETLQEATLTRKARKVTVINLGLDPWEALDMDLEVEQFESKSRKAVAKYIDGYRWNNYDEDKKDYSEWLQSNRIELNAMTTPQFLEWLESKIGEYDTGKVIPDKYTMKEQLESEAKSLIQNQVMQKILRENGFEDKVREEIERIKPVIESKTNSLGYEVEKELERKSEYHWTQPIKEIAKNIVK